MDQEKAKQDVAELVKKYDELTSAEIKKYTEEDTKKGFIEPLFKALGWNITDRNEVSTEESIISAGRVDYSFKINGRVKFYLEAKPLKADLHDEKYANQAVRYAWNKDVDWAVLTDFESVKIFYAQDIDASLWHKLYFEIPYSELLDRFDELWILSKESFSKNLIDDEARKRGKSLQKRSVTSLLYKDLNKARQLLSKGLLMCNPGLQEDVLDEGIQKLLDRIIFLRAAEDRGLEDRTLRPLIRQAQTSTKTGETIYESMIEKFRELDKIYNSDLFTPHPFEKWDEFSGATEDVVKLFYGKKGYYEYDFSVIPADVLGTVYENYLGYQLQKSANGSTLNKDSKKRKEQGIYYTPTYIVDYIVKNALQPVLDKCQSIDDLKQVKVLDPACGSGSFLLKALEVIAEKYKGFGYKDEFAVKTMILTDNLYGVDLDEKAVEIAKLNLLLSSLTAHMKLPNLARNIKNGNSLISGTDEELKKYFGADYRDKKPFNWKEEFPEVFNRDNPGFDIIIGNPPWVSFYSRQSQKISEDEREYYLTRYRTFSNGNTRINTIMLFIERCIDNLRKQGLLGFVLDKQIQDVDAYMATRDMLLNESSIQELILSVHFPHINLDTTVLITRKAMSNNTSTKVFETLLTSGETIIGQTVRQETFMMNPNKMLRLTNDKSPLPEAIAQNSVELGKIARVTTGMCITVEDFCSNQKKDATWHKALFGTNVSRYSIRWPSKDQEERRVGRGKYICFSKDLLQKVNKRFADKGSKTIKVIGDESRFQQPKIFVRQGPGEVKLIATLDDSDTYYANQTLHVINKKDVRYSLKFLLGYLNSQLATFIAKELNLIIYGEKKRPQIRTKSLAKLLVPANPDKVIAEQIENLVDRTLFLHTEFYETDENSNKWHSLKAEIEKTDKKIDQLVYKLYDLNTDEIAIIENG